MTIAITGPRPKKLDNDYAMTGPLCSRIKQRLTFLILSKRSTKMVSGMALGIDTMWAELAIAHRIPLHCYIPFVGQEKAWPKESQDRYRDILSKAEIIFNTSKCRRVHWELFDLYQRQEYEPGMMGLRNEYLVEFSNLLVGVHDNTPGGTANCLALAKKYGRETIIININELR